MRCDSVGHPVRWSRIVIFIFPYNRCPLPNKPPCPSRGDKRAHFERALCSSSHLCIAWPFLGLVIAHFNSLSVEAIERRGGKEGMEGGHEVVKAKKSGREQSARLKSVPYVCPLLSPLPVCSQNVQFDPFRSVSVHFGPFRSVSVQFGPVWAAAGESWGVGWGRGGVGERGFCKGKEYH